MTTRAIRLMLMMTCTLFLLACQRDETPPPHAPGTDSPPVSSIGAALAPTPAIQPATVAPASPPKAPTSGKIAIFMTDSLTLARGETVADALPVWRCFAEPKPTLLLLSNDPGLLPPPAELQNAIAEALASAPDAALRQAGDPLQAAPLFLPGMSVDLALRQGWLRELVWVYPQRDPEKEVKLETLREQLVGNRLADTEEAATLRLENGVFTGRLRNLPFRALPLSKLQQLEGPAIVHIDLSYFQKLYKNEITTPVIPMVGNVLQQLQAQRLPALAVTFSYNHVDGNIPLNVRFLGDFIGALTERPERLDQPLSQRWRAQKDILYLENFFQNDEIRKLVEQQTQESPKTAWVQFNRYHTSALFKEGDEALQSLAKAVALDRMYGLEYPALAQQAFDNKAPDRAMKMMRMASASFPENPFVKLQIAQLAMETADKTTARQLVKELQKLSWSPVYYPGMPKYLEGFLAELEK